MKSYDAKYTYEVHFPHNKEVFYSTKEFDEFVKSLNSKAGVVNTNGDTVYLTVPVSVTYIKQIPRNKKF